MPLLLSADIQALIHLTRTAEGNLLPFAVYNSIHEQHLFNVPISQPVLIFVLKGSKCLQGSHLTTCRAGEFIFLGAATHFTMRNIPDKQQYLALLIEFENEDFESLPPTTEDTKEWLCGPIEQPLAKALAQFIEWSQFAPPMLWPSRRRELLQLLFHLGYTNISHLRCKTSVSQSVLKILARDLSADLPACDIATTLAMSESTLRRKLTTENTSLQYLKDQARLSYGLHLLQTTDWSVLQVAEHCGYQSQSRFTSRFKQRFGLTPSALRQTRLADMGEVLTE